MLTSSSKTLAELKNDFLLKQAYTMDDAHFKLEAFTPFSESLIWQLNREYYQEVGMDAWQRQVVPHHLTSNAVVGKTYAELILGCLKDIAAKGNTTDTVYLLELGTGHGRLTFHVLKHLEKAIALLDTSLPPYCYVVSDIVEDNLLFLKNHPQLQSYYEQGVLDVAYFDAIGSKEVHLRHAKTILKPKELQQPLIAIANYFFDSIPPDLFLVKEEKLSTFFVTLHAEEHPNKTDTAQLIEGLQLTYQKEPVVAPFYNDPIADEILETYRTTLQDSHLFFPKKSFDCLDNLIALSKEGVLLLSLDKGFHELHDLDHKSKPEIITHGSFSLWVNYHALGQYCEKKGGKALFSSSSTFHLELGCLLFLSDAGAYHHTNAAYQKFVNDFGPDDFHTLKKMTYRMLSKLTLLELLALIRLSAYDSTFFIRILPQLKNVSKRIDFNQRTRLIATLHQVWALYFNIKEPYDLAYEIGGVLYDLGVYPAALVYFRRAISFSGPNEEIYYNLVLCYYQLRADEAFRTTLAEAKVAFPKSAMFEHLDTLDLGAN